MRLNPDCIRAILLTVEEKCDFLTPWEYEEENVDSSYLAEYSHEEIVYHIRQCQNSNLVSNVHYYDAGLSVLISDLTPAGHQFLADIRNDNNWNKTKEIAKSVGSSSIETLKQVASGVITSLIQAALLKQ